MPPSPHWPLGPARRCHHVPLMSPQRWASCPCGPLACPGTEVLHCLPRSSPLSPGLRGFTCTQPPQCCQELGAGVPGFTLGRPAATAPPGLRNPPCLWSLHTGHFSGASLLRAGALAPARLSPFPWSWHLPFEAGTLGFHPHAVL